MALVSGKIAAHWLTTGLPVALMAPLLGAQYALDSALLGMLSLSLLIGTPILSLLGAVGGALTLGARGGGIGIDRREAARRARAENLAAHVAHASTRAAHGRLVTVEQDAAPRWRADHVAVAVVHALAVRRRAHHLAGGIGHAVGGSQLREAGGQECGEESGQSGHARIVRPPAVLRD